MSRKLEQDFRKVPLASKKELVERYNEVMLERGDKIVDTFCRYRDTFSRIVFANSEGTCIEEERPMAEVYCQATARDGDNVQQALKSVSNQCGFEVVLGFEESAAEAAQTAIDMLEAQPLRGGEYTVICDPKLAGVFVHEAFGHLSEADFVYANPKAREMMRLGRRFGQDFLNAFDDSSFPGQRATHPFDDEGTPRPATISSRTASWSDACTLAKRRPRWGRNPRQRPRRQLSVCPHRAHDQHGNRARRTSFDDMVRDIVWGSTPATPAAA